MVKRAQHNKTHHNQHPDKSHEDMEAVCAHQRKKDERKALSFQLKPFSISSLNSVSSKYKKDAPSKKVAPKQNKAAGFECLVTASMPRAHVKLLVNRISVSMSTEGK